MIFVFFSDLKIRVLKSEKYAFTFFSTDKQENIKSKVVSKKFSPQLIKMVYNFYNYFFIVC